ncbi:aldo/keto reductase [Flavilitoribacter nigricans]|uniref:Alcohol dehydrogenase n=1 Tax=Flavilitoribacter nigricans (strain ATCC 23147 / DSM 23189 / NBRC 102662 / NCIMB 1420 / SS-2) TaxID=1122177 RepID=A0A2D0NGP0_FLAN2|nr:aldo/keto reductase [Flavilitoribacter nigricans]PHN07647.1 alcohol dehydrogenase [Flavilitoribacter nigricans DSM 23189 = NBRC 102662]
MKSTPLGRTDLSIAPLVFGGNVFGWTIDEKQSYTILDKFLELGFDAIDTADIYSRWADGNSGGESETIIGKWMKERGNRKDITLITKVGGDMGKGQPDLSRDHILKSVDDSLLRLQTDHIDLYLTHFDDPNTPIEETLAAYETIIKAGKVRWIGASNLSPDRLDASIKFSEANNLPRYEVFQPEYNLYDREGYEDQLAKVCTQHELGVITYYALASGFLTGKYRGKQDLDKSVRGGKAEQYLDERGHHILQGLDQISEKHGVSQAAVALAWQMASPIVSAPISSATKISHLEAFKEAAELELTKEDIILLDNVSTYEKVKS